MEVILDTNAVSDLLNGEQYLVAAVTTASRVFIPVVVLGEYRYGLLSSRERERLEHELILLERRTAVLAITSGTVPHYAGIRHELRRVGRPIPANDLWIAALARQHALPVLSRDAHFDAVAGVQRISW